MGKNGVGPPPTAIFLFGDPDMLMQQTELGNKQVET